MKQTVIFGFSDDLLELEGQITDEIDCYVEAGNGLKINASDGTSFTAYYRGGWTFKIHFKGTAFVKHASFTDVEDNPELKKMIDNDYTEAIILNEVEWIKVGRKKYKALNQTQQ